MKRAHMYAASAIYEPMFPVGWVGHRPGDYEVAWETGTEVPDAWRTPIIDCILPCGIKVTAEVCGFTIYDFEDWEPGIPNERHLPKLRSISDMINISKPALVKRLRVINSHQVLLHAAAMFERQESPLVTRVRAFDLLGIDYPDDGGGAIWYRALGGALSFVVTHADRLRAGVMPQATFNLSLEWLQEVIGREALIEFDLLNQAQSALVTHDYALTVVAGWTICELRLGKLHSGLLGRAAKTAAETINRLRQTGAITDANADRLHHLRRQRNDWVHTGQEPSEETAQEAALLAAELLRSVLPNLKIRPPQSMIVLLLLQSGRFSGVRCGP